MTQSPLFESLDDGSIPTYTGSADDPNAPSIEYKPSSEKIKEEAAKSNPAPTPTPTPAPTKEESSEPQPGEPGFFQKVVDYIKKDFQDTFPGGASQIGFTKANMEALEKGGIGSEVENFATNPRDSVETAAAVPLGAVDFAMDVVGNVPGLGSIDDTWDEKTKFSNPLAREIRSISSVVVPSMYLGPMTGSAAAAKFGGANALSRGVAGITGRAAVDMGVAALSDFSERDEGAMTAFDGLLDKMGNPLGMNIPEFAKVNDGDSMQLRHIKLMTEAAGFSVIGDTLGYLANKGSKVMQWFEPKNNDAKEFLDYVKDIDPDLETADIVSQYRQMAEEATDSKVAKKYNDFADNLVEQMRETGVSNVTTDPMESYVRKQQASRDMQNDDIAAMNVQDAVSKGHDPQSMPFTPEVHSRMVDEADVFKQAVPKASAARNAADIAHMQKTGKKTRVVPAPVVTDNMLKKGFMLDEPSRKITAEVAEETRRSGKFDAVIEDARYNQKQMDDAAWQVEADILKAPDVETVRNLFATRRDTKNLNKLTVSYLNDEQTVQAGRALKILNDEFFDIDTTLTSARAIATAGLEASTIAESMTKFRGAVSEDKAMDVIFDKMSYLMEEIGISKYIAGFSLQNQGWWKRVLNKQANPEDILEQMTDAQKRIHERTMNIRNEFTRLRLEDPEKARLFAAAVDQSEGEIDTLEKLYEWVGAQMNPAKAIYDSTGKGGNLWSNTLKGIWFNNVLSGGSAAKAAVGNGVQQLLQPIEYMVGAGITDLMTGGKYEMLKSGWYAYNSVLSTNKQALGDAFNKFMKASKDPFSIEEAVRQDYQFKNMEQYDLLEQSIPILEKEGKFGEKFMAQWTLFNKNMVANPVLRWGVNGMVGIDQYSATLNATASSRFRSYWDNLDNNTLSMENLAKAEAEHYGKIFDKNGVIKDNWVQETTSSTALNQDNVIGDGITALTNYVPGLTPFVAFPKTSTNWIRRSMEYMPVANMVPPKVRDTLLASSTDDIKKAMSLHGISPDDPNLENIFRNQRAMYMGRVAVGTATVMGLMNYALQGNIRGNWPMGSSQKKAWQEAGIKPKSILIGGQQISYDGILPFDPVLTMIGDMALYANDISSPVMENFRDKLIWTLASSYINDTPMGGLEPLVALAGGDDSAAARSIANLGSSWVPASGMMSIAAKTVSSTQKDIYNDFIGYLQNRIPIANAMLTPQVDYWTGEEINNITNPMLRLVNALSPIKYHDGGEDWRKKLVQIGMPGQGMLRKDLTGTFEYTPDMRYTINKLIGAQQPWKKVEKMLNNPAYMDDYENILKHRRSGMDSEKIKIDEQKIPLIRDIKRVLRDAQDRAEQQLIEKPEYAHFRETRHGQIMVNRLMRTGRVPEAIEVQQNTLTELEELKQLGVGN